MIATPQFADQAVQEAEDPEQRRGDRPSSQP
jgi:hypothetical protein